MRPIAACLALVASFAAGQAVFTYRDKSGDLTVTAKSGLVEQGSGKRLKLTLRGSPVVLRVRSEGLELKSPQMVCYTISSGGKSRLKTATASAGLNASQGGGSVSASGGTYTAAASGGSVTLKGAVRLVDRNAAKKETLTVTGTGGTAVLGKQGVRKATIGGPVRAVVQQEGGSRLIATGSRMVLDRSSSPATLVLSGNVNVSGTGDNAFGEIRGADRAVLTLNSAGEVKSVRVVQGASQ